MDFLVGVEKPRGALWGTMSHATLWVRMQKYIKICLIQLKSHNCNHASEDASVPSLWFLTNLSLFFLKMPKVIALFQYFKIKVYDVEKNIPS